MIWQARHGKTTAPVTIKGEGIFSNEVDSQ